MMDVKYNGPVAMTYLSDSANEYSGSIGIELRGASSLAYPQHSYGIETRIKRIKQQCPDTRHAGRQWLGVNI